MTPPWKLQAPLEEGPDEVGTGGKGLDCITGSRTPERGLRTDLAPWSSSGNGERRGGADFTDDLRFPW